MPEVRGNLRLNRRELAGSKHAQPQRSSVERIGYRSPGRSSSRDRSFACSTSERPRVPVVAQSEYANNRSRGRRPAVVFGADCCWTNDDRVSHRYRRCRNGAGSNDSLRGRNRRLPIHQFPGRDRAMAHSRKGAALPVASIREANEALQFNRWADRKTYVIFYLIGRLRGRQPKNLGKTLKFWAKPQRKPPRKTVVY